MQLLLNYQVHSIGLAPRCTGEASRRRSDRLRAPPAASHPRSFRLASDRETVFFCQNLNGL
ncbi:hypothetical protein [Coleofasciculus sp. G2-EDA-02]|uniref:hypothetical protein n=1 Tax=Coleofasciculus sp. G2-EDA-02 TaxID=3069529 RepID=UPI0032F88419